MPAEQIEAYYELLNDIPENVLRAAVLRAIAESDQNFIPAVGMLRKLAAEAQYGLLPTWGQEWERILQSIRKFGRDRSQDAAAFLGPLTWSIVKQVGWQSICNSETPTMQMSMFRNLYENAVQTETIHRRLSEELRPAVRGTQLLTVADQKRLGVK